MAAGAAHQHTHQNGSRFSALWDKLGIIASGLCLVDCIVLPIVSTALLTFQSTFAWADSLHWLLLPVIGVTAGMAFYHSYKAHRSYFIVALGAVGFLLLVTGEILELNLIRFRISWVSIAGSTLLIAAHIKNLRMHLSHRQTCTIDHSAMGKNHFGRPKVVIVQPHVAQVP